MNILALIGDHYHPAELLRTGLSRAALNIQFVDTASAMQWDGLGNLDLLVLAKAGYEYSKVGVPDWLGAEASRLDQAVREGLGLVIVHSGLSGYEANPVMTRLAKAVFTHHPHGLVPVSLRWKPEAELAPAQPGASFEDEQYFLKFYFKDTEFYMHTHSEGHGLSEGAWRHQHGLGRVVCLSPGHTEQAFADPAYAEALHRAFAWAARKPAP